MCLSTNYYCLGEHGGVIIVHPRAVEAWVIGGVSFTIELSGLYHAGSCVIGLIDNKKPALGGLEKAQALRSFLIPTRDNSPAMMPSSHSGLVGTGVAADEAAASAVTLPV